MGDKSSDATWYDPWSDDWQNDHVGEGSQSANEHQSEGDDPPSSDSGSEGGSEAVQGRNMNVSASSSSSAKAIAFTGTVSKRSKARSMNFYEFQLVNSLLTVKRRNEYPGPGYMEARDHKEAALGDIKTLQDFTG